jgi:hypothetical protein
MSIIARLAIDHLFSLSSGRTDGDENHTEKITEKQNIRQTKVVSLLQLSNYTRPVENKSKSKPR